MVLLYKQQDMIRNGTWLGHALFVIGVFLAFFSIILDKPLCEMLGEKFLDAFSASNGVFLACDLCFMGLYIALLEAGSKFEQEVAGTMKKVKK